MILRLYVVVFFALLWFTFIGFWEIAALQIVVGFLIFVRDGYGHRRTTG